MKKRLAVILGAGPVGLALGKIFLERGIPVRLVTRSGKAKLPGAEVRAADVKAPAVARSRGGRPHQARGFSRQSRRTAQLYRSLREGSGKKREGGKSAEYHGPDSGPLQPHDQGGRRNALPVRARLHPRFPGFRRPFRLEGHADRNSGPGHLESPYCGVILHLARCFTTRVIWFFAGGNAILCSSEKRKVKKKIKNTCKNFLRGLSFFINRDSPFLSMSVFSPPPSSNATFD